MGILKKRPKIRLRVPEHISPGEHFVARVEVLADRPVETRGVVVSLLGEAHAALGAGNTRTTRTDRFLALESVPEPGRRIIAGARVYECGFRIADDAPPSFEGVAGWVRYRVKVRVDIPWWPDARETFELGVRGRRALPDAGVPLRFASAPGGPRATEAYLEGSLACNVVSPGELLAGRIALGNVAHHRYRMVKVALVGVENVRIGRRRASAEIARYGLELAVTDAGEGESVPFTFRVPEAVAGFATPLLGLDWFLEVRAVVRLGFDLELSTPIPLAETSGERRERARTRLAPPAVGGERLTEVWQKVAAEVGLAFEGERLAGHLRGTLVVLRREARGKDGTFLVGELGYPSLGLGLEVRPFTLWSWSALTGGGRLKLGREWDAAHRAHARDPVQARAFLAPLLGTLLPLVSEELSDERARVVRQDGGREVEALRAFARDVLALAAVLGEGRAPVPPPGPFAHADMLDSWSRLAAHVEGRLCTGDMSVEGALAGGRVRVATVWDAATPVATELGFEPAHRMAVPAGGVDAAPELRRIVHTPDGLRVDATSVLLTLAPAEHDGDVLWQRLSEMAILAARLRESAAGAYR